MENTPKADLRSGVELRDLPDGGIVLGNVETEEVILVRRGDEHVNLALLTDGLRAERELADALAFRKAMEDSLITGLRARNLQGFVTYVNPAFCAMTGFSEGDLVGRHPPFPHWPPDRHEENTRLLQQELQGRSPAGGIEVKAMRKDGTLFDARMYVSPLIDAQGDQTGWMTSVTNITEAKRVRDQQIGRAHV